VIAMRDPNNLQEVPYNDDKITILSINSIPEYDIADYDLLDEKDFVKFIKQIENNIRHSYEYKQMVNFLRDNMDMNKCSFYENVNNIETYKIKIHIHHEPITLYDLVFIVYNKRNFLRESLSDEMIAKEVMILHYNLLVGLIPLAETIHELVHNQYIFVPTDKVMGRYRDFVNMYQEFMTPEQLQVLERIEKFTVESNYLMNILDKNYIYLDLTGSYKLPRFEDVIASMSRRIDDIKNGRNQVEKQLINPITLYR